MREVLGIGLLVSVPAFQYDPLVVVSAVGNTFSRVPVDFVVDPDDRTLHNYEN